jgi:polar amino acid transport system permease protein
MNELGPLIHSFWCLLRGAAMTVLMATSAVVPATIFGVLLALLNILTSLVSIVGLWELTMASREVVERTLAPFEIFIGAAAIHFCSYYALALYGRHLERRVLLGH